MKNKVTNILLLIAFIILIPVIIFVLSKNNKEPEETKQNRKIYSIVSFIETEYDLNDSIAAYDNFENVAIIKVETINDAQRTNIRGEYHESIITPGTFRVLKNIKGNVNDKTGIPFVINVGAIPLTEWLKGEEKPEEAKEQLQKQGVTADYYISYEIDGFTKKHIVAGETYLAFFNYSNHSEYTISPYVLFKAKEENGKYLIKNEKTNEYESLEKYLPKEVSK